MSTIPERVKSKMKEEGLKGVNKPKRTPSHKTKSTNLFVLGNRV